MALGFETDRLKTGTPSRVDARTIDYSVLESQPGDEDVRWFSCDPEVTPTGWYHLCQAANWQHNTPGCVA